MKIAVTSRGLEPKSDVEIRFRVADHLVLYDSKDDSWVGMTLDYSTGRKKFDGRLTELILSAGAEAIITGHIGFKAFRRLTDRGLKIYSAPVLTVEDAVRCFFTGKLRQLAAPNAIDLNRSMKKGLKL